MAHEVRLLRVEDVPAAFELSTATGWNQTVADWRRMIELEPRGCFGISSDGELVATTTLLCCGTELAWIGMVLTRADQQRRGHARRLMITALDEAHGRGISCIKLDATDQGRPLYESLGFVGEQAIERWRGSGRAGAGASTGCAEVPAELDREAFGADRMRFLKALGSPAVADRNGYVMSRPGTRARYLGPCVARTPEVAARLISSVLTEEPWFWDLLPGNAEAGRLATEFRFEPVRPLVRMRVGRPIRTRDEWVFGIAGFEAG